MITLAPFLKLAGVAIASDLFERKLIRIGRPHQVVLVKIATYVVCGLIAYVEWHYLFKVASALFDVGHIGW